MILGASVREAKRKFDFASIWRRNVYLYGPHPHSFLAVVLATGLATLCSSAIARGGATRRGHELSALPILRHRSGTPVLDMANRERAKAGLPPLQKDEGLTQAARAHGSAMAAQQKLSHQLSGEPNLEHRLAANTKTQLDQAGENVAFAPSVDQAQDSLMHSPPHRANLLNAGYNVAGFSVVRSGSFLYVTQDFGHSLDHLFRRRSGSPRRPKRGPPPGPESVFRAFNAWTAKKRRRRPAPWLRPTRSVLPRPKCQ